MKEEEKERWSRKRQAECPWEKRRGEGGEGGEGSEEILNEKGEEGGEGGKERWEVYFLC